MPPLPRPRHVQGLFAAGLCLLSLLQACGGRSDTEDYLFGDDGSGATGTGASSSTGASSNTGARPGDDPGDGANGSGANGSGATGTAGGSGPIGEGGVASGGTDAGGTGQGGSGVAGSPSGPPVSCGDTTCDSSTQSCCAGFGGFGCVAKGKECIGAVLNCSNSDDCPGNTACCLRVIEADVGSSSQCKAACTGVGPQRERQLCGSNAECASGHCRPTVFGVSVCTRR